MNNNSTKRVLASGVFDVLHPGHRHYLSEAAALGDHLSVVVTSDGHATRSKRPPTHAATDRAALVEALEMVDHAFVGADPYDLAATVRQARPDVIALGYDQPFDETGLTGELRELGFEIEVVRIDRLESAGTTRGLLSGSPQPGEQP